jgi:hypothetical protein
VASYIEEKAEESEHVHLVSTIQSRFSNRAEVRPRAPKSACAQLVCLFLTPTDCVTRVNQCLSSPSQNLVVPGRKFVRQGTLVVWSVKQKKRQPNQVFLFSDLLVVAKSTGE